MVNIKINRCYGFHNLYNFVVEDIEFNKTISTRLTKSDLIELQNKIQKLL